MERIPLTALDCGGKPVTSNNWEERVMLANTENRMSVSELNGKWILLTSKGEYPLTKHHSMNYYHCIANGHKIQVTIKKMVGEIRYW